LARAELARVDFPNVPGLDKRSAGRLKSAVLKRFFQSEVGAALLWVLCAVLLAAVLTPWIYQGGKWLAATAEQRELPALVESVAGSCGRAEIGRFFDRALLFSALVLFPVLLRRIKRMRSGPVSPVAERTQYPWHSVALQLLAGCVIAGGLLWAMGAILDAAGAYGPKGQPLEAGKLISKVVIPAVAAPLIEEWLFRGLLLGLWLRFAKPAAACIGTSLVFAFVHFLKLPDGVVIADSTHMMAGFELLGKILLHFADPLFFLTDFASLFVVGLILAWARLRTGALWFSIGLHAGWVAAFKGYNLLYRAVDDHLLRPWGVGDSLRAGLLPLLALGVTAIVCHFALKRFTRASR
jgi:membrane protease YdiL (CAAX protease family)